MDEKDFIHSVERSLNHRKVKGKFEWKHLKIISLINRLERELEKGNENSIFDKALLNLKKIKRKYRVGCNKIC